MALVEIENLTYRYPQGLEPALRDIGLQVHKGEFVLLTGPTGCGKTTLMRLFNGLVPHFHGGRMAGHVRVGGADTASCRPDVLARRVGMVFQDAEDQLVTTTVEKEIAFGLQNAGLPPTTIAKRIEEMLAGLGLGRLRNCFIPELSGGESQKVALASALALHPEVLVLDEPTSQLDPLSAEELLTVVRRVHEETGTTVVMSEHRLERCYHYATRVLYMEEGRILFDGTPAEAVRWCGRHDEAFVPPVSRVFLKAGWEEVPLTVNQARMLLQAGGCLDTGGEKEKAPARDGGREKDGGEEVLRAGKVRYLYPRGPEALQGVELLLERGRHLALMGENGAGKSTLLRCLLGLLKPSQGRISLFGEPPSVSRLPGLAPRLGYCPQNPGSFFVSDTVRGELLRTAALRGGTPDGGATEIVEEQLVSMGLEKLAGRNPRDLSSGEREKVVMAAATLPPLPELIVLDEPTRGLDHRSKREILRHLEESGRQGCTLLAVTHDVEFAASLADRAAIMGGGRVIVDGPSGEVLSDSLFFSPQVNRLLGDVYRGVVREEQAVPILKEARRTCGR